LNTNSNVSSNDNPLFGGANRYANYAQKNAQLVKNNPLNAAAKGGLNTTSNISSNDNPLTGNNYQNQVAQVNTQNLGSSSLLNTGNQVLQQGAPKKTVRFD